MTKNKVAISSFGLFLFLWFSVANANFLYSALGKIGSGLEKLEPAFKNLEYMDSIMSLYERFTGNNEINKSDLDEIKAKVDSSYKEIQYLVNNNSISRSSYKQIMNLDSSLRALLDSIGSELAQGKKSYINQEFESYLEQISQNLVEINKVRIDLREVESKIKGLENTVICNHSIIKQASYKGECYDGIPHGKGEIHYMNSGESYIGDFIHGERHGIGVHYYNDGRKLHCYWEANKCVSLIN